MTKKYLELEQERCIRLKNWSTLHLEDLRKAVVDGDVTNGSVMAGQSARHGKRDHELQRADPKAGASETDALIGGNRIL